MDDLYMQTALDLAYKGYGFVSPNPMVGAVIVKNKNVIATGFHALYGEDHAEVVAIKSVDNKADLVGSTLYVNLVPCCHTGKTPPCTDLIIAEGIKKVVYASDDPNILVGNNSVKILENAGVEVVGGVLKNEADFMNRKYLKWISTGKPFISLKIGSTLDGKIADKNFESKWITDEQARDFVYNIRAGYDAILIGKNTLLHDNPNLGLHGKSARLEPFRIVLSSDKFEPDDNLDFFRDNRYYIAHSLDDLWQFCSKNFISSILVEGGSQIFSTFLKNGLVDELNMFYGPKLLGSGHLEWCGEIGINCLSEAINFDLKLVDSYNNTVYALYLRK